MREKNKGNLKSLQSKKWIESTLLKLMETERFEDITIQEITDNAELSRRTFYRNFNSKSEVIEECFKRIWSEYKSIMLSENDLSMPNTTRVFFSVMIRHLDFLIIVKCNNLLPLFLAKIDEFLPSTFSELKGGNMPFNEEVISYSLSFSTGGLMKILSKWLDDKDRKSPDEMASMMKKILQIVNCSASL